MDIEIIRRDGQDSTVLIRDLKSCLTIEAWLERRSAPVILFCQKDGKETYLMDMCRRHLVEARALLGRAVKAMDDAATAGAERSTRPSLSGSLRLLGLFHQQVAHIAAIVRSHEVVADRNRR